MEIWKTVPEYKNLYEVSNLGNVRSLARQVPCRGGTRISPARVLKKQSNVKGYHHVRLSKQGACEIKTVHQLVALVFIPDFIKSTEINHIDGVKTNNNITNLEESNSSHNQLHAVRTGLVPKQGVSHYHLVSYLNNRTSDKRWAVCVRHAGKSSYGWKTFLTELEAAHYADELMESIGDTERLRNFP